MTRTVLALVLVLWPTLASAQLACGIKPIRPIGCRGEPTCLCTDTTCQWVWTNCR